MSVAFVTEDLASLSISPHKKLKYESGDCPIVLALRDSFEDAFFEISTACVLDSEKVTRFLGFPVLSAIVDNFVDGTDWSRPLQDATVLSHAIRTGKIEAAQMLINYYREFICRKKRSRGDDSATSSSAKKSGKKSFLESHDVFGFSPLAASARAGHMQLFESLLRAGASVNAQNEYGNTALTQASQSGSIEVVRLLLRHGAIPNIANVNGTTALMKAALAGRMLVVSALLEADADLSIRDNQGMTALLLACQRGHTHVVIQLLDAGACVGDRTPVRMATPLMIACSKGHSEVVEILLARGADPLAQDAHGRRARIPSTSSVPCDVIDDEMVDADLLRVDVDEIFLDEH